MKLWRILVTILACCVWAGAVGAMSTEKLLFEHVGPEDASIPPITVKIGGCARSTRLVILVTLETYESVFGVVKQGGDAPAPRVRPVGTFLVTSFRSGQPERAYTIYPPSVLAIIGQLRQMFKDQQCEIPDTLTILETVLRLPG